MAKGGENVGKAIDAAESIGIEALKGSDLGGVYAAIWLICGAIFLYGMSHGGQQARKNIPAVSAFIVTQICAKLDPVNTHLWVPFGLFALTLGLGSAYIPHTHEIRNSNKKKRAERK